MRCADLALDDQLRARLVAQLVAPALELVEAAQTVDEVLRLPAEGERTDHAQAHLQRVELLRPEAPPLVARRSL